MKPAVEKVADTSTAETQHVGAGGRFHTTEPVKKLAWIRSAGHCEMCGCDLTRDFRVAQDMQWGEVAHIMPASPKGPRAEAGHDAQQAAQLTNDTANLMLLCPGCHNKIDRDAEGYPKTDLTGLHEAYIERIRLAATAPDAGRAVGLIVQSSHFVTVNDISKRDLAMAMSGEGLVAFGDIIKLDLREPGESGRSGRYWENIQEDIRHNLDRQLYRRGGRYGDLPTLAVVGLADIPALIMLGQTIGDRSNRLIFSPNREHGLKWPDLDAAPPDYRLVEPPEGSRCLALVISISAQIPERDVLAAVPAASIATLTIDQPSYAMLKNRRVIHAFRDALQIFMSRLEALTSEPIHVFISAPAALCIELGALMTTEHQHIYVIYDRDKNNEGRFVQALTINPGDRA
ncbi:SAVED domain-containing protein [Xanthomonas hydrangeae]|uniref:SAVED domain-containing protein n=1 Tax=Xanthomonas hydrangeae TaxID=2775159 RepID=A0AAU0BE59_9XANT|nr:SAVED domain-containing protein [Xanthomonas hydrangeae]WOB51315.1 SAVED domain-containing protein [Xanthomonas hydrangeae]